MVTVESTMDQLDLRRSLPRALAPLVLHLAEVLEAWEVVASTFYSSTSLSWIGCRFRETK